MKIGFYSPYLNSFGGGERYVLTLASHWSKNHDVSLFWDDPKILNNAHKRLGIDLSRTHTVDNVFASRNVFRKLLISRGYDLIFFLTDGSIPTTFAAHNIIHFQVPFQHISVHPIKLSRFQAVVCNSDFTKRNIDPRIGRKAVVIYPPVEAIKPGHQAKKKIILSVGRFHPIKKQDVLIRAFRKSGFKQYELVLAGGLLPSDDGYFRQLKEESKGLAVRFLPNIPFDKLIVLYNQSSVYWHGAGYHETKPENMEHFGIAVVEAMSAGAVPVVFNGGGLPEIVREGQDGFLWANTDELIHKTGKIISERSTFARSAERRSGEFSSAKFTGVFDKLLAGIMK